MSIVQNKEQQSFSLLVKEDLTAFVTYKLRDGQMYLVHAEVPLQLRGQGVGKQLLNALYQYMKVEGLNAIAVCPYIRLMATRNSEWYPVIRLD